MENVMSCFTFFLNRISYYSDLLTSMIFQAFQNQSHIANFKAKFLQYCCTETFKQI